MAHHIVDLSMLIQEGMQTFPSRNHPIVEITQLGRHGIENRETRKVVMGTHIGTHVDAPRHFIPNGKTIETLPLDIFFGPATILDFSYLAPKTELNIEDVAPKLEGKPTQRIVFRFDWDLNLGTGLYYTDHPFLSEALCEWLVVQGCQLLGMDSPQPDNPLNGFGTPKDSPNHHILLGQGVILLEYLVNLRSLSSEVVTLVAAPLKIQSGDGGPTRCFAVEER